MNHRFCTISILILILLCTFCLPTLADPDPGAGSGYRLDQEIEDVEKADDFQYDPTLGAEYLGTRLSSVNFNITSTGGTTNIRYRTIGIIMEIGPYKAVFDARNIPAFSISFPKETITECVSISREEIRDAFMSQNGLNYLQVAQLLEYPLKRTYKAFTIRAIIGIYNTNKPDTPIWTFDTVDGIDQIKAKTGYQFTPQALAEMHTRFQTFDNLIKPDPMTVTIHHVEVEKIQETFYAENPPQGREFATETKTFGDYTQFNLEAKKIPGYEPIGTAVSAFYDPVYGHDYITDNPGWLGYPRVVGQGAYIIKKGISRTVAVSNSTNVYIFYKKQDIMPDFQAVSIDPGTKLTENKTYTGIATFKLKDKANGQNLFFPYEADVFVKHNGDIIMSYTHVVFQPGETKTFSFTYRGSDTENSVLSAEIWPANPAWTYPTPGKNYEEVYPPDNKIILEVKSKYVTLTIKKSPDSAAGTVSPWLGTHRVERGSKINLGAQGKKPWRFVRWEGDINTTKPNTVIKMDNSKTVTAVFAKKQFKLIIEVVPPGAGTTDPSPGTHYYDEGVTVQLSATPYGGSTFIRWRGDASGTNPVAYVTMNGNKHVIAEFKAKPEPPPNPNGLGNPILVQ